MNEVEGAAGLAVRGADRRARRGRGARRSCWTPACPGLLAEKDPTLWGPAAEAEAEVRLGWVDTFRRSRELLPALAELRARARRPRPRRAGRHGRLVAGAGGHRPHARRPAHRAGHDRPAPGPGRAGRPARTHGRRGGQQVRLHCGDRLPPPGLLAGVRPTPASRTSAGTSSSSPTPARRWRRPPASMGAHVILADSDVGGRYSALTAFGMVPVGAGRRERRRAARPGRGVRPQHRPRGGRTPSLALARGPRRGGTAGRDKIALIDDGTGIIGLGDWAEQLVAESTGKEGTGILPVVVETPTAPGATGPDVLTVTYGGALAPADVPGSGVARDVSVNGPLGRPVPGLGGGHRAGRRAARDQPVRPAQRGREQGEHRASSSPPACPSTSRCSPTGAIEVYADDARRREHGRPRHWAGCSARSAGAATWP